MEEIDELSGMIEEELNDAEKYINRAIDCKQKRPSKAATFAKLSEEEIGHAMALHGQVVDIIQEYKKEHGEPPEKMQFIYDYLHKKHMKHANRIKVLQGIFKESK